ncbi:S41 family peptidase [Solitalea lacus]|uniref:S41 family peptidase n=1 Tax=Solitalea lacus TaxID=2911172 RepID=UPI001EDA1842|nr:S41 family peptidase [Solitalea lacus]UKJ08655.1 S41 family peptidase [Solitalea lacus]
MKKKNTKSIKLILPLLIATVFTYSCKKDNPSPNNNQLINDWVYENMQTYYYWNDKLPGGPDRSLSPKSFFSSLIYKTEDRFSWIQESAEELQNNLNGISKSFGYEIKLYRTGNNADLVGQVLYVLSNSPASKAGIKRGDIFTKVNGQQLTMLNYNNLLFGLDSFSITFVNFSNGTFSDKETKSLTAIEIQEDPVFLDSVYSINGKKIGYLVYNQFVPGPSENSLVYNTKLNAVFGKFKAQGVNELVMDLRYNTGGDSRSTLLLGSLIVKDFDAQKVFYRREYNKQLQQALLNDPKYGEAFLVTKFSEQANNIGSSLQKLYVLTSSRTASASELLINGLRPYMPVVLVGDTTYGKNVGSITIADETGKIKWGIQPIVTKSFNSLGKSDYTNGFAPDILDFDNSISLKQLGDINESMLNKALVQITGGVVASARATEADREATKLFMKDITSSIDRKSMAYKFLLDDYPKLKKLDN